MKNRVCVFHEYGAPSHYMALNELLASKGDAPLIFRELNVWTQFKAIIRGRRNASVKKFVKNMFFLLLLPFLPKTKIVLGVAPFNKWLPLLMILMKKHSVYYHTSYSCWDGSRMAHCTTDSSLISKWRMFLSEYVVHIFAVSEKTKNELVKNRFASPERISVVNHSYPQEIQIEWKKNKENTFIQVSNLSPKKGVAQLLEYFASHPELELMLVGRGELQHLVEDYSSRYHNIVYAGFISDFSRLERLYKDNCFLLLNSQRTLEWEELFGMVLVEGMACGCVPIATDHPGPQEIITNGMNGMLCAEHDIFKGIECAVQMSSDDYSLMRKNSILRGQSFYCGRVACKWNWILQ